MRRSWTVPGPRPVSSSFHSIRKGLQNPYSSVRSRPAPPAGSIPQVVDSAVCFQRCRSRNRRFLPPAEAGGNRLKNPIKTRWPHLELDRKLDRRNSVATRIIAACNLPIAIRDSRGKAVPGLQYPARGCEYRERAEDIPVEELDLGVRAWERSQRLKRTKRSGRSLSWSLGNNQTKNDGAGNSSRNRTRDTAAWL